jgi:hypothetical protein
MDEVIAEALLPKAAAGELPERSEAAVVEEAAAADSATARQPD